MDKTAQQRSFLNKLRESTDLSGKLVEKLNDEFARAMGKLRETDASIRDRAKMLRDQARSTVQLSRRRDYLGSATSMSVFHEQCRYISAELANFLKSINLKQYKVLLDQFDDEYKEQLFGYEPNKELSVETSFDIEQALIKQAGISDWWFGATSPVSDVYHNLTKQRGIAMRGLEKRFNVGALKKLKQATKKMADKTYEFYKYLITTFKKFASALATRKLQTYMTLADEFIKKFAEYHKHFVEFYEHQIKPLKEQHQLIEQEKQEAAAKNKATQEAQEGAESAYMQIIEQEKQEAAANERANMQSNLPQYSTNPAMQKQIDEYFNAGKGTNQEKLMYEGKNLQDLLNEPQEELIYKDKSLQGLIPPNANMPIDLKKQKAQNYPVGQETPEKLMYEGKNLQEAIAGQSTNKRKMMNLRDRPASDQNFISLISKAASNNDPYAVLNNVLAYSEAIEDIDSSTSLKLLAIAEGLAEDIQKIAVKKPPFFDFSKMKDKITGKEKQPVPFLPRQNKNLHK